MLTNPATKYHPAPAIAIQGRSWPDQTITRAPIWMSTDLRDGNQALFEPMNAARKLRMFRKLTEIGFREIEIAFPSASQTEFDFVRELIEGGHIPDHVTIEVLTQAREPLIRRTMESLQGAKRAIVHVYNATAPVFRRDVFGLERSGVVRMAVEAAELIRDLARERPETDWAFQYSPETFTETELDFAKEIVDSVVEVWNPTPQKKVIVNLPATVEIGTPNRFADQIEWMHRNLARRDSIVLSVHPHNDRGTAVAAAEMALMAGAERVEGTLFGNGERTGNVDIVTLAMNLYTQGVAPGLDFSDINGAARLVEDCTSLPIHPRHPYVGDLVFTAFSGSHQDAIRKGFAAQKGRAVWAVPYLPLDPADVGRSYESIIRVNSQSGKGGIAYLMESGFGLTMPRRLQVEFTQAVQAVTDATGREMAPEDLWRVFEEEYLNATAPLAYVTHHLFEQGEAQGIEVTLDRFGRRTVVKGIGNGPIDALLSALALPVTLHNYEERAMGAGAAATAVAFAEMGIAGVPGTIHGVGLHPNIITASVLAVIGAVNRLHARTGTLLAPAEAA